MKKRPLTEMIPDLFTATALDLLDIEHDDASTDVERRLRIKLAVHVERQHGGDWSAPCPFIKALSRMGVIHGRNR